MKSWPVWQQANKNPCPDEAETSGCGRVLPWCGGRDQTTDNQEWETGSEGCGGTR